MKSFVICCCLFFTITIQAQTLQQLEDKRVNLPNGWSLTPVGSSLPLGDLPLNIVVSKSKKYLAVTNNGQSTQSIQLFDAANKKELDNVVIGKSWYGLAFSDDEKYLYAAGGHDNWIIKYAIANNKLVKEDSIIIGKKWPNKIGPAGIALDDAKQTLYVVTRDNKSLYTINLQTKKYDSLGLGAEAYTCLLSHDKKTLYISLWGGDKVLLYNVATKTITTKIAVGDNPNEMYLTKSGKYLYVANANDNSVSVIDIIQKKVIETLNAALYPNAPSGSTSNGVALSANEKTLYVANADNNCLAVFDVTKPGESKSKGFIPVGWYPTNVKVVGKTIFVSNGKGFTSMANPYGPGPYRPRQSVNYQQGDVNKSPEVQYIAGLFKGTLSMITEPSVQQLGIYSRVVYRNTPYTKDKELHATGEAGNPIPMKVGDKSPIKHVFYILKENRTYDQVLGDVKTGNGDASLVLFGEKYTPNQHALVKNYTLLDNFYVDAEVSADGHNWSMGALAVDYLEKNWPSSYGGRGGSYDAEGNRAIANNKSGFIWDNCKRNNVTYRTYAEFADNAKPNIATLKNHVCTTFSGWDLGVRDTSRFYQWQKDFDSLLAINQVPQLNTIRFGNDHTEGVRIGKPTPFAHVADNDLAVGMFIDYLSKSPIWKESIVFIIEDDAQNGPDHVDAHRSPCYIVGPYVKRNFVDHSMYSTSSVLRTIELILGMPPMTQYDAAANSMWRSFSATADFTPFTHKPSNVNLNDKNTKQNALSALSEKFDFSQEDKVPDLVFNDVLWKEIKGIDAITPSPSRAAFVKLGKKKKDND
ncbi:MAG: bifunctional YncE family protein/alkaline phosphatase family protein [Pedobacter sp.]|nr:bifunctional YncE family protein/alkaline phosphatase family protein [Chitinophagaceae bacterium]